MQPVVVVGAGGHGREVADVIHAMNRVAPRHELLGFIVEPPYGSPGTIVNDLPILGGFDWLEGRGGQVRAVCGVGEPELRRRFAQTLRGLGVELIQAVHPTAVLTEWTTLGAGCVVMACSVLSNQVRLGDNTHVNMGCTVSHDCVLEDLVTLSPGVHLAGGVTVEQGCTVGTGASVIPRRRLGAWSTVGAGCVVIRDVEPRSTVAGVPGRTLGTPPGRG